MRKLVPYLLPFILSFSGCEIDQREILPDDGFTKIYNHPEETLAFFAESVMELDDGGFLFVSAVKDETSDIEYPYAYLVRTNAAGEVTWTHSYDWLAPCSKLIRQGSSIGFVAMDPQFDAYFVEVDPVTGAEVGQEDLQLTMPLHASTNTSGNLLVLGYDFVSRSSVISRFGSSLTPERQSELPINTDLQYDIQRHLNRTGQYYPFFIGEIEGTEGTGYFVNCFFNYTLRTVFLDRASLNPTGNIYSYQTEEGISAVMSKGESIFGLTSYYEGNNYILPNVTLDVSASQNIKDFSAEPLYELTYRAGVHPLVFETDSANYALFVSQTNSSSMVIYQFDMDSDSLLMTHYKEFDQEVQVRDVLQSTDKGLVVLCGTRILGKYRRPLLVKIPVDQFLSENY